MTPSADNIRIEVFRSGTFTPMRGDPISYSAADLADLVTAYDPDASPAPVVVGHPSTDAPAFGWATGFEYDADQDRLFADLGEITAEFSQAVKAGHYKKVSLQLFRPDAPNNPAPGNWYPKHIGFLGAAAPAVAGLKNVAFANDDEKDIAIFEASFGETGFEDTASLLRSLRDFIIEKFGMEDADKVIPSYRLEWLADTEVSPSEPYSYAEPKEPDMTAVETAAHAAAIKKREDDVAAREASFAEADGKRRAEDNVSFAEGLVSTGKLLPASKDALVAILNGVPAEQSVSFAEGSSEPLAGALKQLLEAQPVMVDFSAQDMGDDPGNASTVSFASDGHPIDSGQLELDQKARVYMTQNPNVDYITAVQSVG